MQAGGHRFDPGTLHHKRLTEASSKEEVSLSLLEIQNCTLKTEHCYYECNYEKATVKEKLLKLKGKRYNFVLKTSEIEPA